MEDPEKIRAILVRLNTEAGFPNENDWIWQDATGFHSLMATNVDRNGNITFEAGRGVVTKMFINTETGELKTYYYQKVLRD